MKRPVRLKPIIFWIFILVNLISNTPLKAQDVACYIHKRASYSYIYGFNPDGFNTVESYTWNKQTVGTNLSFPFSGKICSPTLNITVKSTGIDSDSDNCSVFNTSKKGSESYSVDANFYPIPTFIFPNTNVGNANCVSDETAKKYTFTVDKTYALFTESKISTVYLQIANNASFSGANSITIPVSGTATLSYADLAGSNTSAWYGSPLYYRLRFTMSNGNNLYGSTQAQTSFFPELEFTDSVIIDPPNCAYESPTIKIPVSSSEHYIITIKGSWDGAQGYNYSTEDLGAPVGGYYVITESSPCLNVGSPDYIPGKNYDLTIESNYSLTTPCAYTDVFYIPDIPGFTVSLNNYVINEADNDGNFVQIRKRGTTGTVIFNVVDSRTTTVSIYDGTTLIEADKSLTNRTSRTVSGRTYYSGTVSANFLAGTYNNVNIRNSFCKSNEISNVELKQPSAITFTASPGTITCHTSSVSGIKNDGTITISNLSGGIGAYSFSPGASLVNGNYTISGLSYSSVGHTITVTDAYTNSTPKTVPVPQNNALDFSVSQETAPILSCIPNGTVTVSNPSGGTGGYQYSNNQTGTFSTSTIVGGYSGGPHLVYIKDNSNCVVSKNATIPAAPAPISISPLNETPTRPSCMDYYDGKYSCIVSNVVGSLTVTDSDPYISPGNISISGNNISITGLSATNYTITITDTYNGYSCSIVKPFTILPKEPINISSLETPVSDKGTATGSIDITMSSGNTGTRKYILYDENQIKLDSITSTSSTETFSGLYGEYTNGGKAYYIDIVDLNSCSYSEDHSGLYLFRIPEPQDTLKIAFNIIDSIDCYTYSNGTIQLAANGGWDQLYEYSENKTSWSTNNTFSGYSEGNHSFYVKDFYGGTDSVNVYFSQPAALSALHDSTGNVLCNGTNTAWLRYNVTGGTFPYTFVQNQTEFISFNGEDTLLTATYLTAGNYQFEIEDKNGCRTAPLSNTVYQPDILTIPYLSIGHTSCELDNGFIKSLAQGGTLPYNYSLENLDNGNNYIRADYHVTDTSKIMDLPAATYQLMVTDSNNCSVNSSLLTINPYTNPSISNAQITDVACYGESNGEIFVNANNGTSNIQSYTLSSDNSGMSETNTIGRFTDLLPDTYLLYVFDHIGCRSNLPYPAIVTQPDDILSVVVDTIYPVLNNGTASGAIRCTVLGGNVGLKDINLFNTSNELIDNKSERSQFPVVFKNLFAGNYNLYVEDIKGCSFTSPLQTVIEPQSALGFMVTEKNNALCKAQTGSFTVEAFGGWGDYSFKRASDNAYYPGNSFENLYAGSYIVSVRDKYGAVFTDTVVIHEPKDDLQAKLIDYTAPSCENNGSLLVNLDGGTAPYKLVFDGNIDTTEIPTPQDYLLANRPTGNYLLHMTDYNGCKFELETSLSDSELIDINEFKLTYSSTSSSSDGAIEAIVKGGNPPLNYAWRELFGTGLTETGAILSNVPSNYYELTVSETDGCSVSERVYLPAVSDLALEIIELGHETSYLANNGFAQLRTQLEPLVYIELINPSGTRILYDVNTPASDFYEENGNLYFSDLSGGNYHVAVINNLNEKAYAEFEIIPYEQFYIKNILLTHATEIDRANGKISIVVAGGAGNNSFSWQYLDGTTGPLNIMDNEYTSTLSNAVAGNYLFTATDQYNNSINQTVTIEQPALPLDITITEYRNESCKNYEDAYLTVQASGGWGDYQFKQDIEEYFSNNHTWLNLDVREHYFYIIDKMGAVDSIAFSITEPDYLTAGIEFIDSVNCKNASDGNILFNVNGGTAPYRFAFQNQANLWFQDTVARNLAEGSYTFLFTDFNNCPGQDTLTIYMPEPDSLLFSKIDVTHTTCATDNGAITVAMKGGTMPYQYRWTDFSNNTIGTENTVSGLDQNGYYSLDVLDIHNCPQHYEQLISPSTNPLVTEVSTTAALCYGGNTGTANIVDAIAATPYAPYHFTWSNSDTGEFADGYNAGIHSVIIRDTNNCFTEKYFEISQPDSLQIVLTDSKDAHCFGYNDGFIQVQAQGGVGNYQYSWSNGGASERTDSLYKGIYTLTVTDLNLCATVQSYEISEPPKVIVDLGEDIKICPGNGINIDGQEFATHQWSNPDGILSNERFVKLNTEGAYYLEVTNDIGCYAWDTISISIGNDALQAEFLMTSEAVLGDSIFIYEVSNLELDSLSWDYNHESFIDITDNELPEYMLQLEGLETGIFNIALWAYSGGCMSTTVKQIEIIPNDGSIGDSTIIGYKDPLIRNLKVYPNPSDGYFTLKVELREPADIKLVFFSVDYGRVIEQRKAYGLDNYELAYQLPGLNTGVYLIMLTAENERKQIKIIIESE